MTPAPGALLAPAPFTGRIWRALRGAADPLQPAPTAEGLFHHSGQGALYAALSAGAAEIEANAWRAPGETDWVLAALDLRLDRVQALARPLDALDWYRAARAGGPVESWRLADAARAAGAQALIWAPWAPPDRIVVFADPATCLTDTGLRRPFAASPPRDERDMYR